MRNRLIGAIVTAAALLLTVGPGQSLQLAQQPQLFELVGCQQVGLINDEHDSTAALVLFGGQQGLRGCKRITSGFC